MHWLLLNTTLFSLLFISLSLPLSPSSFFSVLTKPQRINKTATGPATTLFLPMKPSQGREHSILRLDIMKKGDRRFGAPAAWQLGTLPAFSWLFICKHVEKKKEWDVV